MFTGIIEEIGKILSFQRNSHGATIEVECSIVLEDVKIGDSIAINGVCQTVTEISSESFKARVSDETLKVTNFENLNKGSVVNIERALTLNSRLGGHIVSGHVDCTARFTGIKQLSEFYDLEFEFPQELAKYIVKKGSITINGISLTVADIYKNKFKVAIIPHTFENTNLKYLNVGDYVNIETDILGKYVEKMLLSKDNDSKISMTFLQENGFV